MGFGKDGKGTIIYDRISGALSTLASQTALKIATVAITEDFRVVKAEGFLSIDALPANEGPVLVALADAELSEAEIKECLEATPLDRNDNLALEQSHRPVFLLGSFFHTAAGQGENLKIEKTIRWTFSGDDGFTLVAYNMDTGALTTGSAIRGIMKYYGVWVS